MHLVTIEKAENYAPEQVKAALVRLLAPLGGMPAFVQPGKRVLLKPNMLSAKPPEAAVTTHPEVLRAVIELVQEAGGVPLVGDSPGIGSTRRVAERSGMMAVIRTTGARLVDFADSVEVAGTGMFKRFALARPYVEAETVINLPKLKTHEMMTMTCAVKNLFGAVVGTGKAAWHLKAGHDRELFARMLIEIYLLRKPELNIVDAITAMEGDGPSSGDPRQVGLLLAGVNPLAVDMVAADLLGIPPKLRYLERVAREMGLDGADPGEIKTAGVPREEARMADFRLPLVCDVQFGLPPFLKKRLRQHLTARPLAVAGKCKLCGICVEACPPRAIEIREGVLRFDYQRCIRCFCCRELCPEAALDIAEGMLLKLAKRFCRQLP